MDGALTMRMVVMITIVVMIALVVMLMMAMMMAVVMMMVVMMMMTELKSWIWNHCNILGCHYPEIPSARKSICMLKVHIHIM